MRVPITEAHPAEVMLAVSTLHVIASLVLLDAFFTLWARLRIGVDPYHVLSISELAFEPIFGIFATHGLMSA